MRIRVRDPQRAVGKRQPGWLAQSIRKIQRPQFARAHVQRLDLSVVTVGDKDQSTWVRTHIERMLQACDIAFARDIAKLI